MLIERHLNALLRASPTSFKAKTCVSVVPTLEPACKLGSDKVEKRLAQLEDKRATLDKGRWTASKLSTVFEGQPEAAWKVVQDLLENMTQQQP